MRTSRPPGIFGLMSLAMLSISPWVTAHADTAAQNQTRAEDPSAVLAQHTESLSRLRNIVILHQGDVAFEYHERGPQPDEPANVKSISKSVISLITGIAIDKGYLSGLDQPIVEVLGQHMPAQPRADLSQITIEHLLSMQSGLQRTSGGNYGAWVASRNWTEYALTRPMVDEPGGDMLYSTGNSHVLSAILQEQTGRNLYELTRDWVGSPLNIMIQPWQEAPEGVVFGGNDMVMSTHGLAWIGQLYLDGGVANGQRVVSESWIAESFAPRTSSVYTNDPYGLGWFSYMFGDIQAYYGRGYGGQLIYVIPQLSLSIAMTSSPYPPSNGSYIQRQHEYVRNVVLPYFEQSEN